jgi:hypothetical protein
MSTPFSPSSSIVDSDPLAFDPSLRRKGALIFAALPVFILLLFQIGILIQTGAVVTLSTWEPLMYLIIPAVLMALTGYFGVALCIRASGWGTVGLGLAASFLWALGALVGGNLAVKLEGAPRVDQSSMFFAAFILLLPYAIIACTVLRFHAKRQQKRAP